MSNYFGVFCFAAGQSSHRLGPFILCSRGVSLLARVSNIALVIYLVRWLVFKTCFPISMSFEAVALSVSLCTNKFCPTHHFVLAPENVVTGCEPDKMI